MSDRLVVAGGGDVTVASEDVLVALASARVLAGEIETIASTLLSAATASELRALAAELEELAARLRTTAMLVEVAIDAYAAAEQGLTAATEAAAGQGAYWAGVVAPLAVALIPTPVVLGLAGWVAAGAPGAHALLTRHRGLLSDPRLVAALRIAAVTVDDAVRGAARLPGPASLAADDRATGALGREAITRAALGALPGPVPAGPLRLSSGATSRVRPPRSLAELGSRIPPPRSGDPQLRVERYGSGAGRVYALYLGGTLDFALRAGKEPWDLASNLAGMGGAPADSVDAAVAALRASGATPSDPVVLVGYSQGGLIASRLAESGEVEVAGMVTVGSPGGAIPPPDAVPVLAVEHAEDLVPALAGPVGAGARVVVSRSLYDGRSPVSQRAVPAHELAEYRSTLALADRSEERRVARVRTELLGLFPEAGSGRSTRWRADRAP